VKYLPFFLCAALFSTFSSFAQPGCTDAQALNYDANATSNDGSCTYGLTEYAMTQKTILPESLAECSGIESFSSGLWIHNDAGNEDKIYLIDSTNGAILQSVIIATGDNIDWEEFAEDEEYLYLGDFGNNTGNRTDLRIYKINKSDLSNNVVNAETIDFTYSDQVDFSANENDNDYDCEAFIFYNDKLHLFSKNWVNNQTKHYTLSTSPGTHIAELKETYNVAGLITGADISEDGTIALIGYTEIGVNFMWLLFDYQDDDFFSGNKRRVSLGTGLTNSQTEGITFTGNGYGYVCSERFKISDQVSFPQKLLSFSISQWIDQTTPVLELEDQHIIQIQPNPFQESILIQPAIPLDEWRIYNANGQLIRQQKLDGQEVEIMIDTRTFIPGYYFLEVWKNNKPKTIKLYKPNL